MAFFHSLPQSDLRRGLQPPGPKPLTKLPQDRFAFNNFGLVSHQPNQNLSIAVWSQRPTAQDALAAQERLYLFSMLTTEPMQWLRVTKHNQSRNYPQP